YPDFLCIGARKAGTTWLHTNLSQHPQVWLPPVKEMHYLDHRHTFLVQRLFGRPSFLRNARQHLRETRAAARQGGPGGSREELRWALRYCLWPRSDKWYRSLFPDSGYTCGEVCPGYARIPDKGVVRVKKVMPDVKLIYLLRDPIECAWSSAGAHFEKILGTRGIYKASRQDVERYLTKKNSVTHLLYAENLANWEKHFPREQILISYFDDLKSNPREVFLRVLDFLGLDNSKVSIPENVERKWGTREGRRSQEIPEAYHRLLAELYVDSLAALDARLENAYVARWHADARAALARKSG
ncbi:MAG TPA: sulfotransferase, partial [Gammaproteobacteria bacterium]|nr:sulfotransferase [Gammaproteobacteria bacterium]